MRAPIPLNFHTTTRNNLLPLPISHFSSTSHLVDDQRVATTVTPASLNPIPNPIYYCLETPPIPLSPISIHQHEHFQPYALMSVVDIPDKAFVGLLNSADIKPDSLLEEGISPDPSLSAPSTFYPPPVEECPQHLQKFKLLAFAIHPSTCTS